MIIATVFPRISDLWTAWHTTSYKVHELNLKGYQQLFMRAQSTESASSGDQSHYLFIVTYWLMAHFLRVRAVM